MKPFDLQKALDGAELVTRDGCPVVGFQKVDGVSSDSSYHYIAVADGIIKTYTENGSVYTVIDDKRDLFMKPEKRTVWLNVYPDGHGAYGYNDEQMARARATPDADLVAYPVTVEV